MNSVEQKSKKNQIIELVIKKLQNKIEFVKEYCKKNNISCESFYFSLYIYTYFKYIDDLSLINEESNIIDFIKKIDLDKNIANDIKVIDDSNFCYILGNVAESFFKYKYLKDVEFLSEIDLVEFDKWNNTDTNEDINDTVIDLFRYNASNYPDNLCIVLDEKEYSYKDVDIITDNLAYALLLNGVKKNDVVSVLIDYSMYKFFSALSILKIGAAYQPLDSIYPEDRIKYIIKDSDAKYVITDDNFKTIISKCEKNYFIIDDLLKIKCEDKKTILINKPNINDLFVIIYTSGSTGNPKGVMLSHKNVSYFCKEYIKFHNLNLNSNFAAYNSFTFVVHIEEYFATLSSGGTIFYVPRQIRTNIKSLCEFYDKNNITNAHLPSQIADLLIKNTNPKTLKDLVIGGEAVKPCIPPKEYNIYNSYGPTECTIKVCNFLIDKRYDNTPIGKPIDNIKVYIVDKYNRRMPKMFPGELLVAGPQVAIGYKNLKELNSFRINKYTYDSKYKNLYATGDIARFLEDGNIEYLGRRDKQVKIRGYRIELNEIEFTLREYPGVKDATVDVHEDNNGNNYLTGYIVSDRNIDISDVKKFIGIKKPEYMIPNIIIQIEAIPYNDHGKVNKYELPKVNYSINDIVSPRTAVEEKLYNIVCKVLNNNNFGVTTNLFDVGVNSIDIMNIIILISNEFTIDLDFNDIFVNNTIDNISKLIIEHNNQKNENLILKVYPLNRLQEWQVDLCLRNPKSTICNLPHLYKLPKEINLDKLEKAIKDVFDAHPGLKTVFVYDDKIKKCVALRDDNSNVEIKRIKSNDLPDISELVVPFNILNDKLYRISIYECDKYNYLFIDIIHAITDGDSNIIIRKDIEKVYINNKILKEHFTAFDYALEEEKQILSGKYIKDKEFYDSIYIDYTKTFLPLFDSNEKNNHTPASVSIFSDVCVDLVKKFCDKNEVTENSFFLAAFGYMLSELNNRHDSIFMTIYNGRNSTKYYDTVALLMKIYTIFAKFTEDMAINTYIKSIQKQNLECMLHDSYAFQDIAKDYNIEADILFLFYGGRYPETSFKFSNFDILEIPIHFLPPSKISFVLKYVNNKVLVDCIYYNDLYRKETVENICKRFVEIIKLFISEKFMIDIRK